MTRGGENQDSTQTFVSWANAFSSGEMDRIESYGDGLMPERANLLGVPEDEQTTEHDKVRITRTAWIEQNAETKWIYNRMQGVTRALNDQSYQYDLTGFSEHFQYTVYDGAAGGHYDWHVDQGPLHVRRKLSMTVQLSEAASYEGCDLQFNAGNKVEDAPRERGSAIAFPSHVLHRVTPVTSGTRRSMVVWVTGPKFR
ncbi:MAG: 2OG-Fe(II) oxygenase [Pseudomonadota bacterium]